MSELFSPKNIEYMERAREVAEKYVRPVAAELDRTGEYGWDILEALKSYGLMGIWIPKEYGGQGAGVLDLCLVVEQLSRACGGVGVAYAVNALGSFPIILGGTEEQKRKYLPPIASGREADRLRPVREGVGLRRRQPAHHRASRTATTTSSTATRSGTPTAAPPSIYTVFALTDPDKGMRGISAFIVEKGHARASRSASARTRWASAACPSSRSTSATAGCRADALLGGKRGGRLQARDDDARPGPPRRGRAGARPRPGRARVGACATPRSGASSGRPCCRSR